MVLEDKADLAVADGLPVRERIRPVQEIGPAVGLQQGPEDAQQGRFAAAGRTGHGDRFSGGNPEGDIPQNGIHPPGSILELLGNMV